MQRREVTRSVCAKQFLSRAGVLLKQDAEAVGRPAERGVVHRPETCHACVVDTSADAPSAIW